MRRTRVPLFDLYGAALDLASDAGSVIVSRSIAAMRGGPDWPAEARLMVSEKARAGLDVQALLVDSVWTGRLASAPSRTLALYRRRIKANQRRLRAKS